MLRILGCLFLFSFLLLVKSGRSQPIVPRDTSFTIQGTYLKERKTRPYIQMAEPVVAETVAVDTNLVYERLGDRALVLDVYYPKKKHRKKPAVMLIFGGGWRSGSKEQNRAMCTELARNGYVAFSPEYRLSLEARYPAAVHDLKTAIRWMRAHSANYGVDTSRIAVLGCSAGGQLAALIGTTGDHPAFEDKSLGYSRYGSKVQAVIDIDGTLAFHHPESVEGKAASEWLGGTYAEKPENWTEAAPLEHVDENVPPFLFLNSSIPRFHAGQTDFIRKADSLHRYTEVHVFPDTPHPFWFFHPWFQPMMTYITRFLHKTFRYP